MSLLGNRPLSPEQQEQNDTPVKWSVVLAVVGTLLIYSYLFTHIADWLHLPHAKEVVEKFGVETDNIFNGHGDIDSELLISMAYEYDNSDERLILFIIVAVAFLSAYFLPLRFKKGSLFIWAVLGMSFLYGWSTATCLVLAHWLVYLVLYIPKPSLKIPYGLLTGVLGAFAFVGPESSAIKNIFIYAGWGVGFCVFFNVIIWPAMRFEGFANLLRPLVIHSAVITVWTGALWEGWQEEAWNLPLGIVLFFWHWERLMMYYVDYKSGRMPKEVSPINYLSVFITPATLPNWKWSVSLGLGPIYLANNFYCVDKNKLAIEGIKIWLIALIYLVFNDVFRYGLVSLFNNLGVEVYGARITRMVSHYMGGGHVTTSSVLATTFMEQVRLLLFLGGAIHFKTGIWRVCGYQMDPYFNKPWMATNLITLWTRFTFHYREFLVRCFYYPVFFKYFKNNIVLRVSFAMFAAVTVGNLIWHVTEGMYYGGMYFSVFEKILFSWPYFVLLAIGIAITELYLFWRKPTRKAWTLDQYWITDFIAMYCTIQFYSIIHIFAKPSGGATVWDCTKLFLIGFGFDMD
jgi:hypothetical protein